MTTPTTTQRGYGADHQAVRARWRPVVDRGEAICAETVCLEERDGRSRAITPGTEWHLAHGENQQGYRGPAHARCNISEASLRMHHGQTPDVDWGESRWWVI